MEFFIAATPAQKGNSKRIIRVPRRGLPPALRIASSVKDKAAEMAVARLALAYRPGRPLEGPLRLDATFCMPVPPSWSRRQRAEALAGLRYPIGGNRLDRGNMLKLLEDALQLAGFYQHDGQIVDGAVRKVYSATPGYRVRLEPLVAFATPDQVRQVEAVAP